MVKIVFVDDKSFKVVDILKKAGWTYTSWLKDIHSLDIREVAEAHIIFVDIQDVGERLGFKDEGLGLILALRQKYPFKKLVVYSAQRTGDRFHQGFSAADARIAKNADPFEFQSLVEQYSREAFSLNECVARLQKMLRSEFSVYLSEDQVVKNMTTIMNKGDLSPASIENVFNVNNAITLAKIISLFLTGKA
jgi:mRNA-degrading endonuclease HigB of HigAB toxin-antitoxin module